MLDGYNKENENSLNSIDKSDTKESVKQTKGSDEGMTEKLLDDIINRLVNYDKFPGFSISENKGTGSANLPYILKEKEIRLLISAAGDVLKE